MSERGSRYDCGWKTINLVDEEKGWGHARGAAERIARPLIAIRQIAFTAAEPFRDAGLDQG
jgi:hypothetical protein